MSNDATRFSQPTISQIAWSNLSVRVGWHGIVWHSKVRIGVLTVALFMALC